MRAFKYVLIFLYRLWFYLLVILPIILLLPILIVSILKESWYPFFFKLARFWAKIILYGMGFVPKISRETNYEKGKSYMFVSNHTSMTDIMLMLHVTPNPFVFVGKKELAKIPLFGFFFKRTCIMVDRSSPRSRRDVFNRAQHKLSQGLGVCIFPEGGIPEDENILLDEFKDGAFRLAIDHHIPIAPMTFHDNKKRLSYDFDLNRASPGKMRVKVHQIIPTGILELEDKRMLKSQTREIILKELQEPSV